MLARQNPKTVLPPIAGKQRALSIGSLAIQIEFGGPPTLDPVFELGCGAQKPAASSWFAGDVLGRNLQVARFFHLVRVRDEEWSFSRPATEWQEEDCPC